MTTIQTQQKSDTTEIITRLHATATPQPEIAPRTLHVPRIEEGQAVRQGDIYIQRVARIYPRGQLASTGQLVGGAGVGSRHVATGPVRCYHPRLAQWEEGVAMVLVARDRFVVGHPEHGALELPLGVYRVGVQGAVAEGLGLAEEMWD